MLVDQEITALPFLFFWLLVFAASVFLLGQEKAKIRYQQQMQLELQRKPDPESGIIKNPATPPPADVRTSPAVE